MAIHSRYITEGRPKLFKLNFDCVQTFGCLQFVFLVKVNHLAFQTSNFVCMCRDNLKWTFQNQIKSLWYNQSPFGDSYIFACGVNNKRLSLWHETNFTSLNTVVKKLFPTKKKNLAANFKLVSFVRVCLLFCIQNCYQNKLTKKPVWWAQIYAF